MKTLKKIGVGICVSLSLLAVSPVGYCSQVTLTDSEYNELVMTLNQVKQTLTEQETALSQAKSDSTMLKAQLKESATALNEAQTQLMTLRNQLQESKAGLTQANSQLIQANKELSDASKSLKQQRDEAAAAERKIRLLRVLVVGLGVYAYCK